MINDVRLEALHKGIRATVLSYSSHFRCTPQACHRLRLAPRTFVAMETY